MYIIYLYLPIYLFIHPPPIYFFAQGVKELIMKDGVSSNEADEMLSYMAFRLTTHAR